MFPIRGIEFLGRRHDIGKANSARRPRFFGLFIIVLVAAGLILRMPRFVPPAIKVAILAAIAAIFAILVFLYIIKEP